MIKFLTSAISRALGFTKTEARGTLILIFIIFFTITASRLGIHHLRNQSEIVQDSSAQNWIRQVHASYSIRETPRYDSVKVLAKSTIKKEHLLFNQSSSNRSNEFGLEHKTPDVHDPIMSDLNKATAQELQIVNGIGPTYSERIIKYRDLLGGFSDSTQLHEVYGLKEETIKSIFQLFKIETPVKPVNLNADSIRHLARHPYISYDLARVIFNYRKEHGEIKSTEDLLQIKALDEHTFVRLKPYLE